MRASGTRLEPQLIERVLTPGVPLRDMIKHKLDVLGNALNGEEEVLEAEEVEGKAPDGSTIDVFMEKILQKVHGHKMFSLGDDSYLLWLGGNIRRKREGLPGTQAAATARRRNDASAAARGCGGRCH